MSGISFASLFDSVNDWVKTYSGLLLVLLALVVVSVLGFVLWAVIKRRIELKRLEALYTGEFYKKLDEADKVGAEDPHLINLLIDGVKYAHEQVREDPSSITPYKGYENNLFITDVHHEHLHKKNLHIIKDKHSKENYSPKCFPDN